MYLLKIATRPWRQSPLAFLVTSATGGVLFFLVGFMYWFDQGIEPVIRRVKGEQTITAFLKSDFPVANESKLEGLVQEKLGKQASVAVIGREAFLAEVKTSSPDLYAELGQLGEELDRVVPRYLTVKGVFGEGAAARVAEIGGIERAESTSGKYPEVANAFSTMRWFIRLLGMGVLAAVLAGLLHLSRMSGMIQRDSLQVLGLMGADSFLLQVPGALSGLIAGGLGGLVASGLWVYLSRVLSERMIALSPILEAMPRPGLSIAGGLLLLGLGFGVISGLGASQMSGQRGG